jgi:hypothetical protein
MLPPSQRRNASVRGGECHRDTRAVHEALQLKATEATDPTAAETKGSSKRVTGKHDELTSSTSPEQSI